MVLLKQKEKGNYVLDLPKETSLFSSPTVQWKRKKTILKSLVSIFMERKDA